ncbi:hypothetical protein B0H13DRAFT_2651715 [Mycena leptocephala]|nr:hypothetical protein B0H13DRAFT_2651715 [Mycena leptocephala]
MFILPWMWRKVPPRGGDALRVSKDLHAKALQEERLHSADREKKAEARVRAELGGKSKDSGRNWRECTERSDRATRKVARPDLSDAKPMRPQEENRRPSGGDLGTLGPSNSVFQMHGLFPEAIQYFPASSVTFKLQARTLILHPERISRLPSEITYRVLLHPWPRMTIFSAHHQNHSLPPARSRVPRPLHLCVLQYSFISITYHLTCVSTPKIGHQANIVHQTLSHSC